MTKRGWIKKRRVFLLLLIVVFLAFDGVLGWMTLYSNEQQTNLESSRKITLAALDKKIAAAKAKKIADAKAAAARTAAANAALADQQAGKIVTPAGCAIDGHSEHQNPNNIDVVVNKKHCFNPINYAPSDLGSYDGYLMSAKIIPDLTTMFSAAAAAGVPLSITSAYRSYSDQVATYDNWVSVNGSTASADTVSARPGYSEHQTGFAVDLSAGGCSLDCFLNTAQFTWMANHAADYGFIQRYPVGYTAITGYSNEAWHYRYVGIAVAQDMKKKGIKTLEQYWNITGGDY